MINVKKCIECGYEGNNFLKGFLICNDCVEKHNTRDKMTKPKLIEDNLPELPLKLGIYLEKPYGGLFDNLVLTRILEEIVSDPYRNYYPKDLEEIVNASSPSIRKSLSALTSIGILKKDTGNQKHPVYRANIDSKRLMALTFLSYAMLDDRDGTSCMDEAIIDYCYRYRLKVK